MVREWFDPDALRRVGSTPDHRFSLANERTFLAWVRIGLALIAGGLAIAQFLPERVNRAKPRHDRGGQPERTRLAWRRTVLAVTAVALLAARLAIQDGEPARQRSRSSR